MPRTKNLIHPGEILFEEFIKPMNISQNRLAIDIRIPATRIQAIVHGERAITADTALRLGKYFGTGAEFWLNLQNQYDLAKAQKNIAEELNGIQSISKNNKKE